ncbi:olfactory receptor 1361-like [Enhydra lutris kenyoni]|uniref:Olfactory receptor 1361-like n=1 Tax=Enhydra lutris kenyoni TaxID=391180 RepID=A0A2Y9J9G5_ENHLU|nr:olfactory receptor 1361-like [Enhydra lutris kenyoni]
MSRGNQSHVAEFLLLGLTNDPKEQGWLFASFFAMYLVNVAGNSVIIAAIWGDARLHTPMYFFLSNLSFVDICFTNVIVPRMLANMLSKNKKVLFAQCLTQMYFFVACAITDSFLLAAMALDRYMAICHPLHYTTTMSPQRCLLLATASWVLSHLHSLTHTILMAHLSFCGPNTVRDGIEVLYMAVISVTSEMDSPKSMEMMGSQSRSQQVVALVSRDKESSLPVTNLKPTVLPGVVRDDISGSICWPIFITQLHEPGGKQWEAKTDLNPALVALSPRTYPDAVWMALVGPCLVEESNSDLLSTKYLREEGNTSENNAAVCMHLLRC